MKKLLCLLLALLMLVSSGCSLAVSERENDDKDEVEETEKSEEIEEADEPKSRKFGIGATARYDYKRNENGDYENILITTAAAVLLDEEGRIAKCDIDVLETYESNVITWSTSVLPRLISKDRFENEILGKLDQNDPNEKWAYTKLAAFYYLYDPNDTTKPESVIKSMYERYPVTKSGMAVYSPTDIVSREFVELNGYIKEYIPEYTFEEMISDHEETMYKNDQVLLSRSDEGNDLKNTDIIRFEKDWIGKKLEYISEIAEDGNDIAIAIQNAIMSATDTELTIEDSIAVEIDGIANLTPNMDAGKYDVDLQYSINDSLLITGTPFTDEELQISTITE